MRRAFRALLPGGVVLLAAVAFFFWAPATNVAYIATTYGLVVYGAGLALAWVFHRSRAFAALCVLGWVEIVILDEPDRVGLILALGTVVMALIGVLALMRDHGIASHVGSTQVLGAGAVAALADIVFSDPERVVRFSVPADVLPTSLASWAVYPAATLFVAVLGFLCVAFGFHRYRGPIERSFVWSLILLMVAMHPDIGDHGSALFLMATGLTVTLGIVETSYVMAYRDELTGLPGRRALMQYLDGIQGTYAMAMVDIDHFKMFNDKHGHDVGDQVLNLVGSRLARVKGGGKAYRFGGEEFTLIFPGRTVEDALPHVEEIRREIAEANFALRSWRRPKEKPEDGSSAANRRTRTIPRTLSVTVSMGLADTADGDTDRDEALKRADEALYRAKRGGRNRIAV
jgi:GGDEF domain-containing protein